MNGKTQNLRANFNTLEAEKDGGLGILQKGKLTKFQRNPEFLVKIEAYCANMKKCSSCLCRCLPFPR